jgi:hypothetical protein
VRTQVWQGLGTLLRDCEMEIYSWDLLSDFTTLGYLDCIWPYKRAQADGLRLVGPNRDTS